MTDNALINLGRQPTSARYPWSIRGFAPPCTETSARKAPSISEPRDEVILSAAASDPQTGSRLRKTGLALSAFAAVAGMLSPQTAAAVEIPLVTNAQEYEMLEKSGEMSDMIDLHRSSKNLGTVMTVHGIHGAPESLQAVAQEAADQDLSVKALTFKDRHTRLTEVSRELAEQIKEWRSEHPKETLTVVGHSMGGRIVINAMGRLARAGQLKDGSYKLKLIAPTLEGYESANSLNSAPTWMNRISHVSPSRDMGTESVFQKTMESVRLPDNVTTEMFVGKEDHVVNPFSSVFKKIAGNLKAEVHRLEGGHSDIVGRVAQRIADDARR